MSITVDRSNYDEHSLDSLDIEGDSSGTIILIASDDDQQISLTRRFTMQEATDFITALKASFDHAAEKFLRG